ncbi:MAG TPA: hypothetical protein VF590_00480 [Isosphaeraceae bacterium]|jgi:hypothetical protein
MLPTIDTIPVRAESVQTDGRSKLACESRYLYAEGKHDLLLLVVGAGERQVAALGQGEAEFALVIHDPLILLGSRFGPALPWSIAPYCWHLVPRAARSLPAAVGAEDEARIQLDLQLAETEAAPPLATGCVTLPLGFTRALHEAIREQSRLPFDPAGCQRALADLRRRASAPESIIARAACRAVGIR